MFQNCNYSEPYINPTIFFFIKIDSFLWKLPTPRTRLDGRFERVFRLLTDSRCGFNATTNKSALKHSLNAQYCYANRTAYVMIFRWWAPCKQIEKKFWFRCSLLCFNMKQSVYRNSHDFVVTVCTHARKYWKL